MLENIEIKGSQGNTFIPHVYLDAATGKGEISGESYLEDAFSFYDKIIEWCNNYFIEKPEGSLHVDFKLKYFNTSSSRALVDLIRAFRTHQLGGKIVTANWYYPSEDDDEIKMEGEDFIDEAEFEMELIEYQLA